MRKAVRVRIITPIGKVSGAGTADSHESTVFSNEEGRVDSVLVNYVLDKIIKIVRIVK